MTDNYFVDDYARFSTLSAKERSTAVANSMNYMTKKGERGLCVIFFYLWIESITFEAEGFSPCILLLSSLGPLTHKTLLCIRVDLHQQAW